MRLSPHARPMLLVALATVVVAGVALTRPAPSAALPDYASKTGQSCGACHVSPAGGGELTAKGKAFQAIASHVSDPLSAWNQVSAASAAPATLAPAPAPATASAAFVSISGASTDDAVVYSIVVNNPGDKPVTNLYLAGSIPAGGTFKKAVSTPSSAGFFSSDGGVAAWLLESVPGKGKVGPFVYSVAKGSARDLAASAFVRWLAPVEGTASSALIAPISNAERLAVEQAINDRFGSYSAELPLWRIQSGTAPQMMALTDHFNLMWYAAQAGNWAFADFEIYRSDETLKAVETTRPARTAGLHAWWKPAEAELEAAVEARDIAAFTKAYDRAIDGCNTCHTASTGGGISLKGVKVVRPIAPLFSNLDYSGN